MKMIKKKILDRYRLSGSGSIWILDTEGDSVNTDSDTVRKSTSIIVRTSGHPYPTFGPGEWRGQVHEAILWAIFCT
jgi:hypothetical protein